MTTHQIRIIFSVVLSLMSSAAFSEVSVNYLGNLESFPTLDHSSTYDALYGNLGQPGGMVEGNGHGWDLGTAITFDPLGMDDMCGLGFMVEVLHMVVVKTDSTATTFEANLAIGDAFLRDSYSPEAVCFYPTPCPVGSYNYPRYCYAGASVTLVDPGYYEIVFSGDFEDHDCIDSIYTHTIASWLHGMGYNITFATDDNPGHCPDHYASSYFWGACNWNELDAPGSILFWTEVSCCDVPVSTVNLDFGTLKSFYR